MKFDTYAKTVLTIIALCLIWICVRNVNFASSAHAKAAAGEITSYQLVWDPRNSSGQVRIKPRGANEITVEIRSIEELAGWAALLGQRPLFQNPSNGVIYTGYQPVTDR